MITMSTTMFNDLPELGQTPIVPIESPIPHTKGVVEPVSIQKKYEDMENLMKYSMLAIMIMIPAAIAVVVFVIGTGLVR
jgi:hypothetical protein